jgi:RecA-family ATPase
MAETYTAADLQGSTNGHLPPGVTWTKALDVFVGSPDHEIFVNGLAMALAESTNRCLFKPHIQQRCAEVRLFAPDLYYSTMLELITATLPQRWREWDHTIDTLCLAMAELDLQPLSEVTPEEITWLWDPYIALKKLTLVEGDPSAGKTYLLLAIAAAVTSGHCLPDQDGKVAKPDPSQCGNVLYITAEDGLADTLRPRAEKVHADLTRLYVPKTPQAFSLAHPEGLRNAMRRYSPRLVVLDPLQAFMGAEMDMHRANEVRPLMTTLLALAIEHTCAIVAIRHWTKASGGRAQHRGQGNVDFAAAARSVLSIGESPEDDTLRVMAHAKSSLKKAGTSIVFTIHDEGLQWSGTSMLTADELSAAQPQRHKKQRQNAMEWLRDYLRDGPQPSVTVMAAAQAVGINEKALRRAKEYLGVLAAKDANAWYWRLPKYQPWDRYAGMEDDDTPF